VAIIGNRHHAEVTCVRATDDPIQQLLDATGTDVLILVTRLNGAVFALNPDLVERADCTPDTVITLVDGTKYIIAESVPEFIDSVRHYRASLIAQASRIESEPALLAVAGSEDQTDDQNTANVLQLHRKDR
jgi:flagellar protein FlbD